MISEEIIKRARYYGAEKQANPDISVGEYHEDLAICLGKDRWVDLSSEQRQVLSEAFEKGREDERKLQ